ncbi:MAG: PASTA domain-containing protein [Candidatus Kapabacteria bacterium]|nr:PASTA domain-containing protein [Candidatus Kapabacteria bacterium]
MDIRSALNWDKSKPYFQIAGWFFGGLFAILFILDSWLLPFIIHGGDSVKIPYLVGKNINSAKNRILDANLDLEKVYEQYSETVPAGQVINQVPKPGLLVKEGRNVYLTVSKGKETVKMPFLIGQSVRVARRTLQTAGLVLGDISYATSEVYGRDTIIVQSMNADQDVIYGQKINVVVSSGSSTQVSMPQLVGSSYSDAMASLTESGLSVFAVDTVDHDTFLSNTIVSQTPPAGEIVSGNTGVRITIAR